MEELIQLAEAYLHALCVQITDRSVGSAGNRDATRYVEQVFTLLGWHTETQEFSAVDWIDGGASLSCGEASFKVSSCPYTLGCNVEALLASVSNVEELERADVSGRLLLLRGEIAREQLMPKNFVFYNPEEHQRIISLLEQKQPAAVLCATGRNSSLAGGAYPFPLIEDGDFDIPSVYMKDVEGERILPFIGKRMSLCSNSVRVSASGCNVAGCKGMQKTGRIVVTAHIDAKKGTPGAIDNATGVVVLLLLAELLKDYAGDRVVELVALNGEDYYSVPGQMQYIQSNQGHFDEILLNINIDGAGYKDGGAAFSYYGLPTSIENNIKEVIRDFDGITEGPQWVQGDHSIFIQFGCPALAVTSHWFSSHIDSQDITHTPRDNFEIVSTAQLVEIAQALNLLIKAL